jgi:hypothetical protein
MESDLDCRCSLLPDVSCHLPLNIANAVEGSLCTIGSNAPALIWRETLTLNRQLHFPRRSVRHGDIVNGVFQERPFRQVVNLAFLKMELGVPCGDENALAAQPGNRQGQCLWRRSSIRQVRRRAVPKVRSSSAAVARASLDGYR